MKVIRIQLMRMFNYYKMLLNSSKSKDDHFKIQINLSRGTYF